MKLEHYFRLIVMSIFQKQVTHDKISNHGGGPMSYDNSLFFCPRVHCMDGFSVSLQIHSGNYCASENGYRQLGVDWRELEFGFPSMNEPDMFEYTEGWGYCSYDDNGNEIQFNPECFDVTEKVGRIPINVMQSIVEKHGGIDWDKTVSSEKAWQMINGR